MGMGFFLLDTPEKACWILTVSTFRLSCLTIHCSCCCPRLTQQASKLYSVMLKQPHNKEVILFSMYFVYQTNCFLSRVS